jgi:sporulation protein YlmC with PRC-barrel domain
MILTDLLGDEVVDEGGRHVGKVIDVRFVLDGAPGPLLAAARVEGLIVSPRSAGSFLGYERTDVRAPWLIAHLLRRRHRGAFLLPWRDVALVSADGVVTLRAGYERRSPDLPGAHRI